MDTSQLVYFIGASMLLTLAPGPDILFVITQGLTNGRKAAIITALGLCSGITVHTTAAALGISAIFYTSALAFNLLKYAGAAYLLVLAWKALRDTGSAAVCARGTSPSGVSLFRRGVLMNILNPKVSLFFLAFLPQFVNPEAGSIAAEMIVLGMLFMLQAVVIFCTVGLFAGVLGCRLLTRPAMGRFLGWGSAAIFAGLGIRLACAER